MRIMFSRQAGERLNQAYSRPDKGEPVEPYHCVADVLAWYPNPQAVFEQPDFSRLSQPMLPRAVAREVTRSHAAACRGVSPDLLINPLNHAIGHHGHLSHDACVGSCHHTCKGSD